MLPLAPKSASGGELSQVMLSLEWCWRCAKTSGWHTMVFDEIDAGVGWHRDADRAAAGAVALAPAGHRGHPSAAGRRLC